MGVFSRLREIAKKFVGEPTMRDHMLRAWGLLAKASSRPRRPKRRVHLGPQVRLDEPLLHRVPTPRNEPAQRFREVAHFYQPLVDGSRYRGKRLRQIRADGLHR